MIEWENFWTEIDIKYIFGILKPILYPVSASWLLLSAQQYWKQL